MKTLLLAIVCTALLMLNACSLLTGKDGEDGEDGKAYISYKWMYDPFYYSTNDPGIPSNLVVSGHYYLTQPGTRQFAYQAWDGSVWSGAYTTYVNKGTQGTKGGFLTDGVDGVDGSDLYFQLLCLSIGASFYPWDYAHSSLIPFSEISRYQALQ
jgi:hypothetical protein